MLHISCIEPNTNKNSVSSKLNTLSDYLFRTRNTKDKTVVLPRKIERIHKKIIKVLKTPVKPIQKDSFLQKPGHHFKIPLYL